MKGRLRVWGANLSLLLVALMITLGGFEAGLRLFLPQKLYRFPRGFFQNDPDLVFALVPGFRGTLRNPEYTTDVRINALGLRGPLPSPKTPGSYRILGLGDSFASAFNVAEPETFLSVAEGRLRQKLPGQGIEVINAGTPNYGTWHESRLLQRLAGRLHPDLVVLCVYVGNDLENNLNPREGVVQGGFLTERRRHLGLLPYPLRSWLQRNCMAYTFLWNSWNHVRPWFGLNADDPLKAEKDLFERRPIASTEMGYRITTRLLEEIKAQCAALGIPLLAVLIPTEYQVYPARFKGLIRRQGVDPAQFDLDLPQRRWTSMAQSSGISVLDLLSLLRRKASGPYLYMSLDGHLSVEGNRLAGEAIAEAVSPWVLRRMEGVAP